MLALFMKPADFDAKCLHKAISGLGTKDKVLIEIMCSRTNEQIAEIKAAYKKKAPKTSRMRPISMQACTQQQEHVRQSRKHAQPAQSAHTCQKGRDNTFMYNSCTQSLQSVWH